MTTDAVRLPRGHGYGNDYPVERMMCDVKIALFCVIVGYDRISGSDPVFRRHRQRSARQALHGKEKAARAAKVSPLRGLNERTTPPAGAAAGSRPPAPADVSPGQGPGDAEKLLT